MTEESSISIARKSFHKNLLDRGLLAFDSGVPTIADKGNQASKTIATALINKLSAEVASTSRLSAQSAGASFEEMVQLFLRDSLRVLAKVRPGNFLVERRRLIQETDQYSHLSDLERAILQMPSLRLAFGSDYIVEPDVVVLRTPMSDEEINAEGKVVDASVARQSALRSVNTQFPILHASISCKWTLRSDRAQNARSEALNLIRNRKGRVPHIAVVTAEPLPSRIASLAFGTGDIDCVYHIALPELEFATPDKQRDQLNQMISGRRLRDISDLPLDLCI